MVYPCQLQVSSTHRLTPKNLDRQIKSDNGSEEETTLDQISQSNRSKLNRVPEMTCRQYVHCMLEEKQAEAENVWNGGSHKLSGHHQERFLV